MITASRVTKFYGKRANRFTALDDVSLSIPTGATVAIVGKSGSGKSTLMHILSGLDRPQAGSIVIDEQDILDLKPKAIDAFRAKQMGFIFQAFFVQANETCYQNVALPLEIAKVPRSKRRKLVEDALAEVELSDKIEAKAGNLSGGQKQRLAIARAIVNKPKVLFADEPTGNLDSLTGKKVEDLLFSLNKRLRTTLIIVTHDAALAKRCKYRIFIKDGQIAGAKDAKQAAPAPSPTKPPVRRRTI